MTADTLARQAYDALAAGQHKTALERVNQAISLGAERPRLLARLYAWKAQSLMGLQRLAEAQQSVLKGIRIAKRTEESSGVEALRDLHRQILARVQQHGRC